MKHRGSVTKPAASEDRRFAENGSLGRLTPRCLDSAFIESFVRPLDAEPENSAHQQQIQD